MHRIELTAGWKLWGRDPQAMSVAEVAPPDPLAEGWMAVDVPGDVNAALVAHGRIPNPHYDTQARQCYWVTGQEWWYRLEFDAARLASGQADLCLSGVDGHADLWLNDRYLGTMKNAFRTFRFPVGDLLRDGINTLLLRFPSIDQLLGGPRLDELAGWKGRRAFLRKPQFCFGWDWALPLPSWGLAGDVWLELDNAARLVDFAVQPFCSGRVDMFFEVSRAAKEAGYEIVVTLTGHGASLQTTVCRDRYKSYTTLQIPDPQLWYPNGYGAQPLYDYVVELRVGGAVADVRRGRLGLREVSIREEPFTPDAGPGFSFHIVVNGEPIFCQGGNWVPLELWPGTARDEQYAFYLQKAHEANFNMLRIWGGGIYERDIFYDLCDELGIMVWQDFMFASTGYPVDRLRDEIIAEADEQIRRLRNHPCIALWCGCNEDVYSWSYQGRPATSAQTDTGVYAEMDDVWRVNRLRDDPQIYSMILRGTVGLLGLGVPYVESSPQSRDDAGNMPNSGNCHISAWKFALFECGGHPERWREHFDKVCSFDSEFCDQGPCAVKSFRRFMAPENLWPPNEAWVYHIQRGHANLPHYEQTMLIAGATFGEIDSLQKYVKYGQATHLEMMRAEFESARRDWPNNGGTMMWMFNDCWPTSNWSIIDYYRTPKPSYYAAKRACAPLLPIVMERAGKIEFFFSNHLLCTVHITLCYGQETLAGELVWSRDAALDVGANATRRFDTLLRANMRAATGDYLFIDATADGQPLPRVIYFPDGWRDIAWPQPRIALTIVDQQRVPGGWQTRVRVQTDAFARLLHLLWPEAQREVAFSDSYFDLSAGGAREIDIQSTVKPSPEELRVGHWWTEWE